MFLVVPPKHGFAQKHGWFLAFEASLIEEHKKMFEKQNLFKEYSSFDFMWRWSRFQVIISSFNVQYFFSTFWSQLFVWIIECCYFLSVFAMLVEGVVLCGNWRLVLYNNVRYFFSHTHTHTHTHICCNFLVIKWV